MTNDLKIMHTLEIINKRSYNIKCDTKKSEPKTKKIRKSDQQIHEIER